MGHSSIRIKIRRRKVANLAAYSRQYTVNNCTIPAVDEKRIIKKEVPWGTIDAVKGTAEFKIPECGFPQVKPLRKKYKKKYYFKGMKNIRKIISHPSDYDAFDMSKYTLPKMNHVEYMEKLVEHKTKKWERNHPCPIKDDKNSPDLFEAEYLPKWKAERDLAIERFRDFVVSIYDKLPLSGRFKESDNKYVEKEKVAEIKDINGEGHKVNELNPKKSKLLKKAQKETNKIHAKNPKLVACNLKDHKRQKGRLILPQVA